MSDTCAVHLFLIRKSSLQLGVEELATGKSNNQIMERAACILNIQKRLAVKKKQVAAQQAQQKNNAAHAALSKARNKP